MLVALGLNCQLTAKTIIGILQHRVSLRQQGNHVRMVFMMKRIYILTGGTMVHVTPHFALCAPAYGTVGVEIFTRLEQRLTASARREQYEVILIQTKMAGANRSETMAHLARLGLPSSPETNIDVQNYIQAILRDAEGVALVMAAAICDFEPVALTAEGRNGMVVMSKFGKEQKRLHHVETLTLQMRPSDKIIDGIKTARPDLKLVTFKTTAGVTEDELFEQAFYNLQKSQSDLVFANDIQNYQNMVVTAAGERLLGADRLGTLDLLCETLLATMM